MVLRRAFVAGIAVVALACAGCGGDDEPGSAGGKVLTSDAAPGVAPGEAGTPAAEPDAGKGTTAGTPAGGAAGAPTSTNPLATGGARAEPDKQSAQAVAFLARMNAVCAAHFDALNKSRDGEGEGLAARARATNRLKARLITDIRALDAPAVLKPAVESFTTGVRAQSRVLTFLVRSTVSNDEKAQIRYGIQYKQTEDRLKTIADTYGFSSCATT